MRHLKMLLTLSSASLLFALTGLPMKVTVQTGDTLNFTPFISGWNVTATNVTVTTTPPSHGTLQTVAGWFDTNSFYIRMDTNTRYIKTPPRSKTPSNYPGFRYIPAAGYTGGDTFTYKVRTSLDSTAVTKVAIRVTPPEPGNMTVLLVVNSIQFPALQADIERLRDDLVNEGYRARICQMTMPATGSYTVAHNKQVWDTLNAEYERPGSMLAGALMVGAVAPVGGYRSNRESPYWGLSVWELDAEKDTTLLGWRVGTSNFNGTQYTPGFANIWVSRLWGRNGYGTPLGTEAVLLKRMLQANHDYRTGASRYPRSTTWYDMMAPTYNKNLVPAKYGDIWSNVVVHAYNDTNNPVRSDFKRGGELFEINTHGNEDLFNALLNASNGPVWRIQSALLQQTVFPFRFMFSNGCHVGALGAMLHSHLLLRNSACVLAIGTTDYVSNGEYLCDTSRGYPPHTWTRNRLARGERWGSAWLHGNANLWMLMFHGDLSLKPNMTPPNSKPLITDVTAVKTGPLSWNFSVTANDPDGAVSLVEWWGSSYRAGTFEPDSSGTSTTFSKTYASAAVCTVRVEVADQYKARDWAQLVIKTDSGLIWSDAEQASIKIADASGLRLSSNPFHGRATVRFGAAAGQGRLKIFSADGRLVHTAGVGAGARTIAWDGRDLRGRLAGSGLYLFRLTAGSRVLETRGALIR